MRFVKPEDGQKRIVKKFAVFPIRIGRISVWLETVYIAQIYEITDFWSDLLVHYYEAVWKNEKFVDKKRYIEYKKEKEKKND